MPLTDNRLEDFVQNAGISVFLKRRMMFALQESPNHPSLPALHASAVHQMDSVEYAEMGRLVAERLDS